MGRRKSSIFEDQMQMPWWCSPMVAAGAYLLFAVILPGLVPDDHPAFAAFQTVMPQIAPYIGILLLIPMPFAYLNGRSKQKRVDRQDSLETIRNLPWNELETLVAEVYRRKGYQVIENSGAGPDGGVDIRLSKNGDLHLVQCKQWKARKVGVPVVREMYGVLHDQKADFLSIVTSGRFTEEAKQFASDKPVDLIDGPILLSLVNSVREKHSQRPYEPNQNKLTPPPCPRCGKALTKRMAKKGPNAGNEFLGCTGFPNCRYTQNL
jgi:restriction system protein